MNKIHCWLLIDFSRIAEGLTLTTCICSDLKYCTKDSEKKITTERIRLTYHPFYTTYFHLLWSSNSTAKKNPIKITIVFYEKIFTWFLFWKRLHWFHWSGLSWLLHSEECKCKVQQEDMQSSKLWVTVTALLVTVTPFVLLLPIGILVKFSNSLI